MLVAALAARAATLDGTVTNAATGAPIRKARVTARAADGVFTTLTDTAGHWSIASLPDGEYDLTVECQGHLPPAAKRPPVRAGEDTSISLTLLPLSVISGRVLDEDGDPAAGIEVLALAYDYSRPAPALRSVAKAVSDDRGEFRLFDLRPGRYYAQAIPSDRSTTVLYHSATSDAAQAAPIDLAPGAEAAGIEFRLRKSPLYRLAGRAVDAVSSGPSRALVIAEANGPSGWRYSAPTRPDGSFEFPAVRPGSYVLTFGAAAEQTVRVASRDVDGVLLTAHPAAPIHGLVRIDGSTRALNLRVTLEPADRPGFSATAYPKPDGTFTVSAAPRVYALQIEGIPFDLFLRDIRFGAEDAADGRLDLRRGAPPLSLTLAGDPGSLVGTVHSPAGTPAAGVLVAITPADPAIRRHDLTRSVHTDFNGRFGVSSLAPGDYLLFAWEEFDAALAASLDFRHALAPRSTKVTVRRGTEEAVLLRPLDPAHLREARSRLP
jgi:hypothetical protein